MRSDESVERPQIAIRAETTRAAHDTFIDTLYGPTCTVHRLISLSAARLPLEQKSGPKLPHKSSTSYSLPAGALSYLRLLDFRDCYYARSRLLDHLSSDGFN
jgi:hypothetical protein